MRPRDHPSYQDYHLVEREMEHSKVQALWAIAAELHEMNARQD